jgi:ribose transport system permease protein
MTSAAPAKMSDTLLDFLIKYRTIVILLVLSLIFALLNHYFLYPTNLLNMLKRMSYTAIVAFSMTFVITLGGLDLSVGSLAALVGVSLGLLLNTGMPLVLAILICLVFSVGLGGMNGVISVKGKIEPFLVTLATLYIFSGLALVLSNGTPIPIVSDAFNNFFGNGLLFNVIPTPVLIMAIILALSLFLFKTTKFGFYVRAIGGNPEAAKVAGINISQVKLSAYMLSGAFACISGLILAALMSAGMPDIGADLPLDAIAGVILGGTAISGGLGSIWGTVGGTLIMAILSSGMALLGAQSPVQVLVKGIVIILAVLLDNMLKSRGRLTGPKFQLGSALKFRTR